MSVALTGVVAIATLILFQPATETESTLRYIVEGARGAPAWVLETPKAGSTIRVKALSPPAMPPGQVCQLWLVADNTTYSLGLLPDSGEASLSIPPALGAESERAEIIITIEARAASPSPSPSTTIISRGRWSVI